jgi:hypothetical protein
MGNNERRDAVNKRGHRLVDELMKNLPEAHFALSSEGAYSLNRKFAT